MIGPCRSHDWENGDRDYSHAIGCSIFVFNFEKEGGDWELIENLYDCYIRLAHVHHRYIETLLIPAGCSTNAKGAKRPFDPRMGIVVCLIHLEPQRVLRFSRRVKRTK